MGYENKKVIMKHLYSFNKSLFSKLSLNRQNFDVYREEYIDNFIKRIGNNTTRINNIYWIPTIKQAPELEATIKTVYKNLLKSPLSYLNYFSYLEDGFICRENMKFDVHIPILASHTQLLSEDIIGWLIDLDEDTEYKALLDKIVIAVENNVDKWMKPEEFWKLPSTVQEKLNYLTRGKKTNMWDMKKT